MNNKEIIQISKSKLKKISILCTFHTAARLGWMEESDPEGCDFVSDERSIPLSLTDCTICKCPGLGLI
jgi:hypothetical protein